MLPLQVQVVLQRVAQGHRGVPAGNHCMPRKWPGPSGRRRMRSLSVGWICPLHSIKQCVNVLEHHSPSVREYVSLGLALLDLLRIDTLSPHDVRVARNRSLGVCQPIGVTFAPLDDPTAHEVSFVGFASPQPPASSNQACSSSCAL